MNPRLRAALALLGLALALTGCEDEGTKILRQAKEEYRALVQAQVPRADPRFEGVRQALRKVPPNSRAYPEARSLLRSLEVGPLPTRPLALPDQPGELQGCELLAQVLGKAESEEQRRLIEEELAACRKLEERRKAREHSHPGEEVDAHR